MLGRLTNCDFYIIHVINKNKKKEKKMNSNKKTAIIVGVLFLAATVTYMIGNGLLESVIKDPDYLSNLYPNKTQVIIAVLLELINDAAVVGIGFLMFQILKQHNESLALGYLSIRIIESAILIVSGISPLLLITLSQEYIKTGTTDAFYYQTLGTLAIKGYYLAFEIAMIATSLGGLILSYLLYKSKLIPRLISVLGLGYAALLANSLVEIFGYSTGIILFLPGALFELIFPIWLIVKGFNSSAMDFESKKILKE